MLKLLRYVPLMLLRLLLHARCLEVVLVLVLPVVGGRCGAWQLVDVGNMWRCCSVFCSLCHHRVRVYHGRSRACRGSGSSRNRQLRLPHGRSACRWCSVLLLEGWCAAPDTYVSRPSTSRNVRSIRNLARSPHSRPATRVRQCISGIREWRWRWLFS
jgi:hypothetical protein